MNPASKLPSARDRIGTILAILKQQYPDAHCALSHENPLQLLIATILSAQCTDARVNLVTPALFARYRTVHDFATCQLAELEQLIKPTGFYKNKAKHIRGCCAKIIEQFGGEVPAALDELVTLPGIGRKTANVVLGDAFGIPGITVDTHVGRLSRRLGLTPQTDPVKVEFALMKLVPQPEWTIFSHRLIFHGRQVCHARKPSCESCALSTVCPKVGVAQRGSKTVDRTTTRRKIVTSKTEPTEDASSD